jgi:hypothetical protein
VADREEQSKEPPVAGVGAALPEPISLFAESWVKAGLRAPRPAPARDCGPCSFYDCPQRPIVEIRTSLGTYVICHHHFEAVMQVLGCVTVATISSQQFGIGPAEALRGDLSYICYLPTQSMLE